MLRVSLYIDDSCDMISVFQYLDVKRHVDDMPVISIEQLNSNWQMIWAYHKSEATVFSWAGKRIGLLVISLMQNNSPFDTSTQYGT